MNNADLLHYLGAYVAVAKSGCDIDLKVAEAMLVAAQRIILENGLLHEQVRHLREDAARVDWLTAPNAWKFRIQGSNEKTWSVLYCADGLTVLARGCATAREAIDEAMRTMEVKGGNEAG